MKGYIAVILLMLSVVLFYGRSVHTPSGDVSTGRACSIPALTEGADRETDMEVYILNSEEKRLSDIAGEIHHMPYRINAPVKSTYRFISFKTLHSFKLLLRDIAVCMANLTCSHTRVYDTSRCFSWDDARDHYIFGMRRILI